MLLVASAHGQAIDDPQSWQQNQAIDEGMRAMPGWQELNTIPPTEHGVPLISPLYKQQPPAAQEDFRVLEIVTVPEPAPDPVPAPEPDPEPAPGPDPEPAPRPEPDPDPRPDPRPPKPPRPPFVTP